MLNERKEPRFDSVLYLPVIVQGSREPFGHLVNISEQGLMVVAALEREPGDAFILEIDVPEHFQMSGRVIIDATLRWCRPDANPELFAYGLTVTRPSAEFQELQRRLRTGFSFSH